MTEQNSQGDGEGIPEERREAIRLFTESYVNLEIFSAGETVYDLRDIQGENRQYRLPNDVPFHPALDFGRAHDAFVGATVALAGAGGKNEEVLSKRVETCWDEMVRQFHRIVAILQPEATIAELSEGLGRNYLWNWMHTLGIRLEFQKAGADVDAVLMGLLEGGIDKPPKATSRTSRSTSSSRSGPSAGSTDGPTTTGGR